MKSTNSILKVATHSRNRIETFTDIIFGFLIVFLMLEIKLPDGYRFHSIDLRMMLTDMLPKFISFLIAFLTILVWWIAHHQLLQFVQKTTRMLFVLNGLFVLFLTFITFPIAIVGEYYREYISVLLFGTNAILIGLSFLLMRWYICFKAKLVSSNFSKDVLIKGMWRGMHAPVIYFAAILIGLYSVWLAYFLFAVAPLYYFVPAFMEREKKKKK